MLILNLQIVSVWYVYSYAVKDLTPGRRNHVPARKSRFKLFQIILNADKAYVINKSYNNFTALGCVSSETSPFSSIHLKSATKDDFFVRQEGVFSVWGLVDQRASIVGDNMFEKWKRFLLCKQ